MDRAGLVDFYRNKRRNGTKDRDIVISLYALAVEGLIKEGNLTELLYEIFEDDEEVVSEAIKSVPHSILDKVIKDALMVIRRKE